MTTIEINAMLAKINQAVEEAKGDKKKEAVLLSQIIDPQDANSCEGCQ